MKWLLTGARGMLGTDLLARAASEGEVVGLGRAELDLLDPDAVRRAVRAHRPDVVVNCAAWTAVDLAEEREGDALAVNGTAVLPLAAACGEVGAKLVQISTDYVFDGAGSSPYPEDAPTTVPVNAYGRTKLAGERAVLETLPDLGYVVRTAWLYGARGHNFVKTMIRLAGERDTVDVVDDQLGQPTWSADLADALVRLTLADAPAGIYHGTSSGETTWYGLAREIFTLLGLDPARVRPVSAAVYARPAPRPAYSVLGHDAWAKAGLAPIRDWRAALEGAWPAMAA
ncbi:dTDP-4-dehydrorhamnose reductase [Rhizohabitans arisaemae]|uniref:dTDP-4-dehydrorhamnose reductase n=1 Tax=Rhizohabitans arisaemae TaxID=2720610 RepID=UPI0024B0EDE5|nr:dTDP-4-dehydrorhamnose reductase [Rhizohabitans arisaemae]